ncbi:amiloride-sensitive sodium channel subunit gamma-like [Ptychodera flava]|uniref:amiloride-sensitive sodium channel subunit gamma-like n=1 Tax=Ptychodera flava TaxID=63121 RepID=UPI00396A4E6B
MSNVIHVAPYSLDDSGLPMKSVPPPPSYSAEPLSCDETPKKEKYGDVIQQFADNTTAHGIPRIVNSKYAWAKVLWFLIVGSSTGVFVWQASKLVTEYFSWPVDVSIDVISKKDVAFPAVTVCNMNRIRRSEMEGTRFEGILDIDGGAGSNIWDYGGFEWYFYSDMYSDGSSATSEPATGAPSSSAGGVGRRRRRAADNVDNQEPSLDEFHPESDQARPLQRENLGNDSHHPKDSPKRKSKHKHGKKMHHSEVDFEPEYPDHEDYPGPREKPASRQRHPIDRKKYADAVHKLLAPEIQAKNEKRRRRLEEMKQKIEHLKAEGKLPQKMKRKKRAASSSSSSQSYSWSLDYSWFDDFDWDFDMSDFEYYDYGWDGVTGEDDWAGFYANSKMEDFSDLADVANPTDDELKDMGHQAVDLILQCTFDKRPCNYTHFNQWQNKNYGNCFTFNHGINEDVRKTSKSGSQYGLHLTLFIEQPEYVGLFSQESGVRMAVTSQGSAPFPEDVGVTVNPGQATSVGLRRYEYVRQPAPYGNCTSGDEVYMVNQQFNYSVVLCMKECLQKNLIERCGCVTDVLIDYDKCSVLNTTQQRCRQVVEALYEEDDLNCTCKNPCHEVTYAAQVSSSLWPSERYETHLYGVLADKSIKAAITLQDVTESRRNLVRLKVFFEELNFQTIIQTKAYKIENLLGDIGGTLGLYIGLSVITVVEIIVFFLHTCRYCCRRIWS